MKIDKERIINYLLIDNSSGYKTRERHIIQNFPDLMQEIKSYQNSFKLSFAQCLYNVLYDIKEIPKCETCSNSAVFRGIFREGYLKNCSKACRSNSIKRLERMQSTNLERHGDKHISNISFVKEKKLNHKNNYVIEKFKKAGYEVLDINQNNLEIKHPDGHIFSGDRKILINRLNGNVEISTINLPLHSLRSTYEIQLEEFFKEKSIPYEICNRKILSSNKEMDFYFPDKNIALEIDGLYWHSELFLEKNYHLNKTIECNKANIQLLHVFEDELIHKIDIVKSIILSKLSVYENKIGARKCSIKELTPIEARDFFEKNHIQDYVESKIKIGLVYEDKIVCAITFGSYRKSLGLKSVENEYELIRFANALNTSVTGGASKLFQYFLKTYNPNKIISFADRRYSNGKLYLNLGFRYIGNTIPNYWYVNKSTAMKYHRFRYRKDVLVREGFDKNKTEHEIMLERGYMRIYDCGNLKFEWIKN